MGQVYYDNEGGKSDAADPTTQVGLNSSIVIGGTNAAITTTRTSKESNTNVVTVDMDLKAYPNPTHSSFNLVISSTNKNEKVTVKVMDVLGRLIEQKQVDPNQIISIGSQYRPGIYFVRAIRGDTQMEVKLNKIPD